MTQLGQIAAIVVAIRLDVIEAVSLVGRSRQAGNVRGQGVVMTGRADQAIQGVVAEFTVAVDPLIGEPGWLEDVVFDADDIADAIVEILQILQSGVSGFLTGARMQASIGRVIRPLTQDTVTGQLRDDLIVGVVLRIQQDLRDFRLDLQLHLPELPGKTIARCSAMAAGIGLLQHRAQRAEHLMAGESLCVLESSGFLHRLAGEGIAGYRQNTRRIGLLDQPSAQVVVGGVGATGVEEGFDLFLFLLILSGDLESDDTQLVVKGRSPDMAALVPTLPRLTGQSRQYQTPAGIDAVDFQHGAVERVVSSEVGCR